MSRPKLVSFERSVLTIVAVVAAFVLTASCSLDWSVPAASTDAGGTDGHDDVVSDASSDDRRPSTPPDQPDGTTVTPTPGCTASSTCASQSNDQNVCIFAAFDCGAKSAGSCVSLPLDNANDPDCTTGGSYCGCDGQLYANSCDPLRKGVDLAPIQTCGNGQTDGTQAGYASCPASLVMVEDPSRPHTSVYRCADATACGGTDCQCLLKLCTKPGGACSTPTRIVCP